MRLAAPSGRSVGVPRGWAWRALAVVLISGGVAVGQPAANAQPVGAAGAKDKPAEKAAPVPAVDVNDTGFTVGISGRFRVLGSSVQVRRMFASQAEAVAEDYGKLFERQEKVSVPVVVQLHEAGSVSPVRPSVVDAMEVVGGQTFRLVIHVRLDDGATPEAFAASVVRCLLVGDIIRGRRADEISDGKLVPEWLEIGVRAALEYRREPGRSAVTAGVFARGRAFPVEKLLAESPAGMPAASRAAYEASACGLILTLLAQENGHAKFLRMLSDFADYDGDAAALIRHHFQALAESDHALEKWWALQVAQMARPGAMDFMDGAESDRRLAQAVVVEAAIPAESGGGTRVVGLAEVLALPDKAERERLVRQVWLRLRALGPRVHPLFRPLAAAQQQVLEDVMAGKKDDMLARLAALDAERAAMAARLDAIDDYLNWWEVTQGAGNQKDLERFRKATRRVAPAARKDDPIGAYLDEMQKVVGEE